MALDLEESRKSIEKYVILTEKNDSEVIFKGISDVIVILIDSILEYFRMKSLW